MTNQTSMFEQPEQPAADLRAAVGCAVYHRGEHGVIVAYLPEEYATPMCKVRFGERVAILKPSEIGAA